MTAECSPPNDWVTLTATSSVAGSIIGNGLYKENPGSTTQLPGERTRREPGRDPNFLANYYTGNQTCSVVGTVVSDG